jgi:tetratricopeptide (TPR) repeat protein
VGDEVVIFAEFVEGGSLETLIRTRRLTSLEQILDAAIQFAWGLHAANELELVHQDVKPGNALVTADGVVKVADFGLARARSKTEVQAAGASGQSFLVSCRGMTPAYCSPAQAQGRPLSRQTDIWSWGVSVLEMFTGAVTWSWGTDAAEELEAYLQRPVEPELPAMPKGVAEVLRKCFRRDPAERWASLAEAAEVLQRAYREEVGKEYPRPMPAAPDPTRQVVITHDRFTTTGYKWDDPREWLIKAFKAEGRDPAQVEAFLPRRADSRKAQAIADLAAYEEAERILERLVADGRIDLEPLLASLCLNMAFVHQYTGDVPGAAAHYDRAISIRDRLVSREGQHELANALALACVAKAEAESALGNNRAAVGLCDRAFSIFKQLVKHKGGRKLAPGLLALACNVKANAVSALGEKRAATALYDRAISIYEQLKEHVGRREWADDLAAAYVNKAIAIDDLGDRCAAVALYDLAIPILERRVEHEGQRQLAPGLAVAYMNKAAAVSTLGDKRAAADLFERAIVVHQALVEHEVRRERAKDLALACMNKAIALSELGDHRAAVDLYDRAIAIRKQLVEDEGRWELQGDLAWVVVLRAKSLLDVGEHQRARSEARTAIPVLKAEITRTGRADLRRVLIWATKALQEVL